MKTFTSLGFPFGFCLCSRAHSFAVPVSHHPISALSRPSFSLTATNDEVGMGIPLPELEGPTVELTETELELIARNLKETIDFPFLPNVLEKQIVKAALTSFCKIAPVALPEGLFQELVSGEQNWDNVREEVIHIINDEICIPIVSREVQDQIVGAICSVMFTSRSKKAAQRQILGRTLQTTLNQGSEEEFATMLNGMVDIPFMSEEKEQETMRKLARSIHNYFETMVPAPMREMLMNTSPEELREARENLIDRLNEKTDIPFKTEEEERIYFASIVDFLLKRYGIAKDTKFPEEELVDIAKELAIVEVEFDVQEAIFEKKIDELTDKKIALFERKAELEQLVDAV